MHSCACLADCCITYSCINDKLCHNAQVRLLSRLAFHMLHRRQAVPLCTDRALCSLTQASSEHRVHGATCRGMPASQSFCSKTSVLTFFSLYAVGLKRISKCHINFFWFCFTPSQLLPKISARGVMVAGGLHPEIATKYFRCAWCLDKLLL